MGDVPVLKPREVAQDPSCVNGEGVFIKVGHRTFPKVYVTSDECDAHWISSGQLNLCLTWGEGSQSRRTELVLVTSGDRFEMRRDLSVDAQGETSGGCHPDFPKALDTRMAQWLVEELARLVERPAAIARVCARLNPDIEDPLRGRSGLNHQ